MRVRGTREIAGIWDAVAGPRSRRARYTRAWYSVRPKSRSLRIRSVFTVTLNTAATWTRNIGGSLINVETRASDMRQIEHEREGIGNDARMANPYAASPFRTDGVCVRAPDGKAEVAHLSSARRRGNRDASKGRLAAGPTP